MNWHSFNVGIPQSVNFQQPNAQAITLNTVTGPNPSQIAGKINANGQIVLVNQSGVTFYKGAQVNTAGLMVSAAGANTTQFMNGGKIAFNQAGNPNAQIINNGNITISGAGLAGLVAPNVANSGVINAKLGHVVLAGGTAATLDLYGDKLVSLNVTGAVTQAPGGGDALVTNTGVIRADGGTVQLTARAVDGLVTNLVSAGGKIQANTVGANQGRITIDGVGGSITITGDVQAEGKAPGTAGGKIGLLASDAVIVKSGAMVNASGAAGGGTIAVGTTLKRAAGGPTVTGAKMAKGVLVQQGATIAANATGNGDGGRVTVLSSQLTVMEGSIQATGGPAGGNGGFVEVSGGVLSLTGGVNVSGSASGLTGTLLLDPTNLDIVDAVAPGSNIDNEFTGGKLAFSAADAGTTPSTITATKINALGAAGNVTIQATGSIEFQDIVTAIAIGNDLTVQAGGNLLVDRGVSITTTGANLSLTSGADPTSGLATNAGSIALGTSGAAVGAATLVANALVLNAGSTGINLDDASITVTNLANLNALGGGATQVAAGVLSAGTLGSSGGIKGTVSLAGTTNTVTSIGSIAVSAGDFTLVGTSNLGVAGALTATNISLSSNTITATGSIGATTLLALSSGAGGVQLNTGHILSGATVDLSASGGGVTQVATGTITATSLLKSSSNVVGGVTLAGTLNAISGLGKFAVTGGTNGFSLSNSTTMPITGAVTAPGNIYIENSSAGGITIQANASVGAGASGLVGFQTDAFTIVANGKVSGGTFELAPNTKGNTIALGSGYLSSLAGILSNNVRIGAVTVGGSLVTTAGSINIASSFGTGTVNLELDTNGALSQLPGAILTAQTLTGTAAGALLPEANIVNTLGSFNAGTLAFSLNDAGLAGNLTVSGPVTGSNVTISGVPTITVTGSIGATTSLVLSAGLGGIQLNTGEILSGATVDLSTLGGGVTQVATGTIIATSLLQSTGSVSGTVDLAGTANAIAAVGSFVVNPGDFILIDNGNTANLALNGPLTAGNITIGNANTGTISVNGSLGATATKLILSSGSGGIQLNTGDILSAATVDLSTLGGGVTQVATGTITASSVLQSAAGIKGTVSLAGTANNIAEVGSIAVTAGDFSLVDNGNTGNLFVNGTVTAGNISLSNANTGTISVSGSLGATTSLISVVRFRRHSVAGRRRAFRQNGRFLGDRRRRDAGRDRGHHGLDDFANRVGRDRHGGPRGHREQHRRGRFVRGEKRRLHPDRYRQHRNRRGQRAGVRGQHHAQRRHPVDHRSGHRGWHRRSDRQRRRDRGNRNDRRRHADRFLRCVRDPQRRVGRREPDRHACRVHRDDGHDHPQRRTFADCRGRCLRHGRRCDPAVRRHRQYHSASDDRRAGRGFDRHCLGPRRRLLGRGSGSRHGRNLRGTPRIRRGR